MYVENDFSFNLKTNCSLLIMRLLDNTDLLNQFTTSLTQGTTELNFTYKNNIAIDFSLEPVLTAGKIGGETVF